MAADVGKIFEKQLIQVFNVLKKERMVGFHRLADTGAAGSVIAPQPSDFLLALPPGSESPLNHQRLFFLEAKASEKHHTLQKAAIKPAQRGAIAHYRHLLQLPYLLLFWDAQDGVMQLWDGIAAYGDQNLDKRRILTTWPDCGVINKLRTDHVAACFVDYFRIPLLSDTLAKSR